MVTIKRTNSKAPSFVKLVALLDAYLKEIDGDDHIFYNGHNSIAQIDHVVVAYQNELPIGCGAFKMHHATTVEIKRMYVLPEVRGLKIASKILSELENWAKEEGFTSTILETGKRMPDAIAFYKNRGYGQIPNYGQYVHMDNSKCFEKQL